MRERFNRSEMVERALQENYTCCEKNKSRQVTLPDGTWAISMGLSFLDANGGRRFNVHAHVRRDAPMFLVGDDGANYKLDA